MSAEWICDGCGRRAPGVATQMSGWRKPRDWYERNLSVKADGTEAGNIFSPHGPEEGTFQTILSACSRECIAKIAERTGTHSVVLPV